MARARKSIATQNLIWTMTVEASHSPKRIVAFLISYSRSKRHVHAYSDWAIVSKTSSRCARIGTESNAPKLNAKTTGMIATRAVSSLTADETKLSNAMGASLIFLAQWKAVTFSGNSDKNGAIHWMKKKPAPAPKSATAIVLIESTNGCDMNTKTSPDRRNNPTIAPILVRFPRSLTIALGGASKTSSGSSFSEGSLDKIVM